MSKQRQPAAATPAKATRIKTALHRSKSSVKTWALEHGYPYGTVSDVLRGKNKATYGMGHEIAVALGLKEAA